MVLLQCRRQLLPQVGQRHIESLGYVVGDVGVLAELVGVGLCSSITDSKPGAESCL